MPASHDEKSDLATFFPDRKKGSHYNSSSSSARRPSSSKFRPRSSSSSSSSSLLSSSKHPKSSYSSDQLPSPFTSSYRIHDEKLPPAGSSDNDKRPLSIVDSKTWRDTPKPFNKDDLFFHKKIKQKPEETHSHYLPSPQSSSTSNSDSRQLTKEPETHDYRSSKSTKRTNYQVIYDPDLSRTKSGGSKPKLRYNGEGQPDPTDPRFYKGIRYTRSKTGKKEYLKYCTVPVFIKDENTIAPPAETKLLMSGLSTLTKKSTIMYKLLEYGPISDLEMVHDQTSGEFLGVCYFKFDGEPRISNKIAQKILADHQHLFIDAKNPHLQFDEKGVIKERIISEIIKTKNEYFSAPKEPQAKPDVFRNPTTAAHSREAKSSSLSTQESKPSVVRRKMYLKSGKLPVFFEVSEPCIFISNHFISTRVKIMPIVNWFSKQTDAIFVCPRYFIIAFRDRGVAKRCFKERNNTQFGLNVVSMKLFLYGITDVEADEAYEAEEKASKLGYEQLKKRELEKASGKPILQTNPREMKQLGYDINKRSTQQALSDPIVNPYKNKIPITSTSSATAEISVEEKSPSSNRFNPLPSSVLSLPRFKKTSTISAPSKLQLTTARSREKVSARPMNHGLNDDSSDEEDDDSESATQTPVYPQAASDTSLSTTSEKIESSPKLPLQKPENPSENPNEEEPLTASKSNKSKRRNLKEFLHYTSSEGESDGELAESRLHKKLKLGTDNTIKTPLRSKSKLTNPPVESQITPEASPTNHDSEESKKEQARRIFKREDESLNKILVPLISPEEESEDEQNKQPKLEELKEEAEDEAKDIKPKLQAPEASDAPEYHDPEWDSMFEEHPISQEITNPKLSWDPSEGQMEPVCVDDFSTLLDLDGFQTFVKDDEDLDLLKQVLKGVESEDLGPVDFWCWNQKEMKSVNYGRESVGKPLLVEGGIEETLRWSSQTGASRSDGFKRIADKDKAAYLPHRRKIHEPIDTIREEPDTSTASSAAPAGGFNSRHNRASNRRLANDISLQKQMLSTETDILNFNQLKKRKKPVKFARSAIHNWGLYAIEPIAANDMIIEYVGEVVRQKVAELREKKYLRSGIGSSYLFRIDEQTVIDATKLGGIARFINHSCTPSCTAKIIKVEGKKRIVIYALRDIQANEELTYDYKFEREVNDEERIPCLCGSSGCKGYLN